VVCCRLILFARKYERFKMCRIFDLIRCKETKMTRHFIQTIVLLLSFEATGQDKALRTGAEQLDLLLPRLAGKRIGLLINYTANIGKTPLVDTLRSRGVNVVKIFSPEHGFRGTAVDGEEVADVRLPRKPGNHDGGWSQSAGRVRHLGRLLQLDGVTRGSILSGG